MKKKLSRIQIIKEIITTSRVGSQEELLQLLSDRGFELTQATLSRDLKQMKVVKSPTPTGGYAYWLPENSNGSQVDYSFAEKGFISLAFSGNMAVVKTKAGYASSIASEIDEKAEDVILGTVAGDDTIFIVIKENVTAEELKNKLSTFIKIY